MSLFTALYQLQDKLVQAGRAFGGEPTLSVMSRALVRRDNTSALQADDLNADTVTMLGIEPNAANGPVKLGSDGKLPALDGSNLTNVSGGGGSSLPLSGGTMSGDINMDGNSIDDAANIGTAAAAALDTDPTMAADSDTRVPSQAAVRAYVAASSGSLGYTYEAVPNYGDGVSWLSQPGTKEWIDTYNHPDGGVSGIFSVILQGDLDGTFSGPYFFGDFGSQLGFIDADSSGSVVANWQQSAWTWTPISGPASSLDGFYANPGTPIYFGGGPATPITSTIGTSGNPITGRFITITPGGNGIWVISNGASAVNGQSVLLSSSPTSTQPNTRYIIGNTGGMAVPLPTTASLGDTFEVIGHYTSWTITQAAGQQILCGSTSPSSTTMGTSGYVASATATSSARLVCVAVNTWVITSHETAITLH
jgi:hypothetical protein